MSGDVTMVGKSLHQGHLGQVSEKHELQHALSVDSASTPGTSVSPQFRNKILPLISDEV